VPDPENGNMPVVVRKRRRTQRHRRNRQVRRWLAAAALAIFTAGVSTAALTYFSPSLFRAESPHPSLQQLEVERNRAGAMNQAISQVEPSRPVYPYSVVPGGVEDAKELKWVAEHDPIVAAHYAGFDYARAQVVRLTLARTVYMSYRIGNHIYWTRHRVALHKGEKLITDGKMTARGRCANRVEETPQQPEAAAAEPTVQKFDEPISPGTAMKAPPVTFQSALLSRPEPGLGPAGPLSLYDPFVGGGWVSVAPPPLPEGLCGPTKKKGTGVDVEIGSGGKKKKAGPCGTAPGTVPEPGTWLMFISGLAAISWQARRKLCRA
jgi:hypothetical protein